MNFLSCWLGKILICSFYFASVPFYPYLSLCFNPRVVGVLFACVLVCLLLAFFLMFLFFSILLFLKEKELKVGGGREVGRNWKASGRGNMVKIDSESFVIKILK